VSPAEPPRVGDGLQRPLVLRSCFQPRLTHSVSASGSRDARSLEVLRTTKVEELERAVTSSTVEEYREFRRWLLERDWEHWDWQLAEDSRARKQDFLVREAFEAKERGKLEER
jgi:hypothetical protein